MTDTTLPMIRSYLPAADQLITVASRAVLSFFVPPDAGVASTGNFVGFIRDSLVKDHTLSISTGGMAVSAQLCQLEQYFPYLEVNGHAQNIGELRASRFASQRYFFATKGLYLREGFGHLNPLTSAILAYVGCQNTTEQPWNPRAVLFNAVILAIAQDQKWPVMENVDKSHPYVAYNVLRAIRDLRKGRAHFSELLEEIRAPGFWKTLDVTEEQSNLPIQDVFADVMKRLVSMSEEEISAGIEGAIAGFGNEAEEYLWGQNGYAPTLAREQFDSLSYDPVGTCFALNVLLDTMTAQSGNESVKRILGEYASLVFRSVQHVLKALPPSGSLPYGIPFAYEPRGTGAFATSIAGLAVFARFLTEIFRVARSLNYPSGSLLQRLIEDNIPQLELLFGLLPVLESTRRSWPIDTKVLGKRTLTGWWTDRAPSRSRVESWVTIEVLQFAIYVRELLQECGQFLVMRKYGAVKVAGEPAWPYGPEGESILPLQGRLLQDPDKNEERGISPIPFLNSNFGHLLNRSAGLGDGWETKVSSVLLFGPPGTAKSTTIRSLAEALDWHFVELTPSNFVIDGMEKIEQRAKEICDDLSLLRETVVLFDELDSLLVDREMLGVGDIIQFVVPAMLPRLQALSKAAKKQRVLLAIATNYYDRLDAAMVRLGRIDKQLLILPYNQDSRMALLEQLLGDSCAARTEICSDNDIRRASALYVYEEVKELARNLRENSQDRHFKASAICSSLYLTRIPKSSEYAKHIRSTHRLALEVCEVVGRSLGKPRELSPESDIDQVRDRLDWLANQLQGNSDWLHLCNELSAALAPHRSN